MKIVSAILAIGYGAVALAQSSTRIADGSATIVSGIDPSDIAAIPDPDLIGPPIGIADDVPCVSYDAAAVTSSVLALVTAATDAQTSIISSGAPSTTVAVKRSFVGGNTNLHRRDSKYPIDTKSFGIPNGYTPAFISLQGATQGRGYLTYKTLKTYDPSLCTAACDNIKTCVFANIYYEKDPDAKNNPVDVIKCSLYSMYQTNATATNKGQWRGSFQILITGSNGYNKAASPNTPAGYSIQSLPAAVNAPIFDSQGQGRFIQPVYLDTYSTDLCAAACDKQTQWDKSQSADACNYKTCVYANLYMLNKDGAPQTVVCALYTEMTDPSAAVNNGYSYGSDFYQVSNSVALVNTSLVQAGYPMYCDPLASDVAKLQSVGGDFCTSYLGYSPSVIASTVTQTPAASTVQVTAIESTTETSTTFVYQKRSAIPTPSFIANWPAQKISAACSQVATGSITSTATVTVSTSYVAETVATSTSTVIVMPTQTCAANIVTDGNFTTGLNGWNYNDRVSYDADQSAAVLHWTGVHNGQAYGPDGWGGVLSQSVDLGQCAGQSFTFEFTYYMEDSYHSPGCSVTLGGLSYDWTSWYAYEGATWQTFSRTIDTWYHDADETIDLSFSMSCEWYADLDILVRDIRLGPSAA